MGKYYGSILNKRGSNLTHFGIKGQKWGVRRFQNEDGTLTAEGRERYLQKYKDAENDAIDRIKIAKNQLDDIEKNGWNAKSAFDPQFVKDYAKDLGIKPKDLPKEDLDVFIDMIKDDLVTATADLKTARQAREFIQNHQNVTLDEILEETSKIDNESNTESSKNRNDEARELAGEMNLEIKDKINIKDSTFTPEKEKELKALMPKQKDVQEGNRRLEAIFKELKLDKYFDMNSLKKKSDYEQFWIMFNILDQTGIFDSL